MTKEEIIEAVRAYISDGNNTQAILINGEWGSGKTYLYDHYLVKEIISVEAGKNERKANAYISLYGLSTIEDLSKNVLTAYMLNVVCNKQKTKGKVYQITNGITNFVSRAFSFTMPIGKSGKEISINLGGIVDKIEKIISSKNMVICFDDFERCTIPINELFGFINNLVEHCNCKVIILADEKNIGKMYANTNLEMKYATLLTNRRLVENKENDENNAITLGEIKELNEKVYSENYFYKDIKEKVVGRTLLYEPNLDEVLDSVIETTLSLETLKVTLKERKEEILDALRICRNTNIRIIKNWLLAFQKIVIITKKHREEYEYYDEIFTRFMIYSLRVANAVGKNVPLKEWKKGTEYGEVELKDGYNFDKEGYKFIDRLILNSTIVEKDVLKAANYVNNVCKESNKEKNDVVQERTTGKMLAELKQWYIYEDYEIEEKIECLKKEIKDGKYMPQSYQYIVALLVVLKNENLCGDSLLDISNIIMEKVAEVEGNIEIENFQQDFGDEEMQEEFRQYYDPVYNLLMEKSRANNQLVINNFLDVKDIKGFTEYCQENHMEFVVKGTFINCVDIDMFVKCLEACSLKEVYELVRTIEGVYCFSNLYEFYSDDVEGLEELRNRISALEWRGITRIKAQKCFERVLEEKISDIRNEMFL